MAMVTGGELVVRTLMAAGGEGHLRPARGAPGDDLPVLPRPSPADRRRAPRGRRRPRRRRLRPRRPHARRGHGDGGSRLHQHRHLDRQRLPRRTPVLYIAGSASTRDAETNTLQAGIDQVAIAAPITKWAVRVANTADIPRLVAHAIRLATSGPTGPVLLDMPSRRAERQGRRGQRPHPRDHPAARRPGTVGRRGRPGAGPPGRGRTAGDHGRGRRLPGGHHR